MSDLRKRIAKHYKQIMFRGTDGKWTSIAVDRAPHHLLNQWWNGVRSLDDKIRLCGRHSFTHTLVCDNCKRSAQEIYAHGPLAKSQHRPPLDLLVEHSQIKAITVDDGRPGSPTFEAATQALTEKLIREMGFPEMMRRFQNYKLSLRAERGSSIHGT